MAAVYEAVTPDVIEIAEEIIERHHPELGEARICLLFRDVGPKQGNKRVMGKARKVSPDNQAMLETRGQQPYDFILWFAYDIWEELNALQRRALVDHELCHCHMTEAGATSMKLHDYEDFTAIIDRYGFWQPGSEEVERAFQSRFDFAMRGDGTSKRGKVETVQALAPDVEEQIDALLAEDRETASMFDEEAWEDEPEEESEHGDD